jgi:SNF family Na+-dependent transporter
MMSDELVQIFLLFIIGLMCRIISWLSWTRQEVTSRFTRYRREDSPFAFWFNLTAYILSAVVFTLGGIVFSISLLRP